MPKVNGKLIGGAMDDKDRQRVSGANGGNSSKTASLRLSQTFPMDKAYKRWRKMMRELYGS